MGKIYLIFSVITGLSVLAAVYLIVQSFRKKQNGWLTGFTLTVTIILLAEIILILTSGLSPSWENMLVIPLVSSFLLLILLAVLLFFSRKLTTKGKIFTGISATILAAVLTLVLVFMNDSDFGSTCRYRKHIYGDYYLRIDFSNYYPVEIASVSREKMFFILSQSHLQNYDIEYELQDHPDEVNFVRFNDSMLVFNVKTNGSIRTFKLDMRFESVGQNFEGLRVVRANGFCGAIDDNGKIVIPLKYTMLGDCYRDRMMASEGKMTGFINSKGDLVIPYQYESTGNFLSDSACALLNHEYFYVDKNGKRLSSY